MAAAENGNGSLAATDVTYEDLINLEHAFDDAEVSVLRFHADSFAPLYARREALVSRIPNFWALVIEQAPIDLDQYIRPSDSEVFAECLKEIKVERFDAASGENPRSFTIVMRFDPAKNQWFDDVSLTKRFMWRRARDGWTGLVSEPVKVHWKKGKDLSDGLTDAAVALWAARQKAGTDTRDPSAQAALPEHKALASQLEANGPVVTSFFAFFSFVSERRYVTAEESAAATKTLRARRDAGRPAKEYCDIDEETERLEMERLEVEQEAEVCAHGSDIANFIAEDLYPDAIKYFTAAQEQDDEGLSSGSFEDDDDDDEVPDSDMSAAEIDIRALVANKNRKRDKNNNSSSDAGSPGPKSKRSRS